jgi:hypothetical protein
LGAGGKHALQRHLRPPARVDLEHVALRAGVLGARTRIQHPVFRTSLEE